MEIRSYIAGAAFGIAITALAQAVFLGPVKISVSDKAIDSCQEMGGRVVAVRFVTGGIICQQRRR